MVTTILMGALGLCLVAGVLAIALTIAVFANLPMPAWFRKWSCDHGIHSFKCTSSWNYQTEMPEAHCLWCGENITYMFGRPPESFMRKREELLEATRLGREAATQRGFTFIELIVVVAIVGILSTIVLYSIQNASPGSIMSKENAVQNESLYPEPTNYVVDTSGVLTSEQLASLNAKLSALDTDKHQFAVVVVKSLGGLSIEEYAIKIAEKWKVGYAGVDNGAIIVLAPNERDVRIEVGYGLEGDINDAKAGRIIDEYMMASLKEGAWYDALVGGVTGLEANVK